MTRERWRPVPGFQDYYEVSSTGVVRNVGYELRGKWRQRDPPRPLTPRRNARGRLDVTLSFGGECWTVGVAWCVLTAFRGAPPRGRKYAIHRDGDPSNVALGNLKWGKKWEADGWAAPSPRPGRP